MNEGSIPLIDQDIESNIQKAKETYVSMIKNLSNLSNICNSKDNEFYELQNEFPKIKKTISNQFDLLNRIVNTLSSSDDYPQQIQKQIEQVLQTVNHAKLEEKQKEFSDKATKIENRIKNYNPLYSNDSTLINDPLLTNNLVVRDYAKNSELMENRIRDLEDVHIIAAQVASLSNEIKKNSFLQGEQLSQIESNVDTVKDNALKGEKETKYVEVLERRNRKRLYIIVIFLIVILIILYYSIKKLVS